MREIKFRAWNKYLGRMLDMEQVTVYALNTTHNPVMQYTGLKDKNGKEIYEGDVTRIVFYHEPTKDPVLGEVKWSESFTGYSIYGKKGGVYSLNFKTGGSYGDTLAVEIIGNIYENPELLK